jgi:hypothetical protein
MANKNINIVEQAPVVDKKQNMTITFWDYAGGEEVRKTKTFLNIIGHQVGQQWVAVITSEDETLVFSAGEVKQIRVWKE